MRKAGRQIDPNSIDSIGRVVIAVDRPCREDLKALAKAAGLTLVEYLRTVARGELENGKQSALLGQGSVASAAAIEQNAAMIAKMEALEASYSELQLAFCGFVRFFMGPNKIVNPSEMKAYKAYKAFERFVASMQGEQLTLENAK